MNGNVKQVPLLRVLTVSLLVMGTTVGAGILAFRLTRSAEKTLDLATLFEREIGPLGKHLCMAGYFIVFYGILVAYLTGATEVLVNLGPLFIPRVGWTIGFFLLATGLTLFGEDLVCRGNAVAMVVLAVSFALLLAAAGRNVSVARFHHSDWGLVLSAVPIIACAFSYHMIIPTACRCLDWDFRAVWRALCLGTGFALVMNLTWVIAVLGAIPLTGPGKGNLVSAFDSDLPATVPLSLILGSKVVTTAGMVFAFSAILTSYLGVGIALIGFIQDVGASVFGSMRRNVAAGLTFGPPLIVGLVYPNIFLRVLNLVGGFGLLLLFGILPALLFIKTMGGKSARRRLMGYALLAVLLLLMVLELAQECGWLRVKPEVEHWNPPYTGKVERDVSCG